MKELLLVFLGGGIGSLLRALLSRLLPSAPGSTFPWSTFAANLIGCFLIGLLSTAIARHSLSPGLRPLLITGLCGGFTTFSTFSSEALAMLRLGHTTAFFCYTGAGLTLGVLAVLAGTRTGQFFT